jgi:hypothetical protein
MGIKKRTPPDLDAIDKRMARDDGGPVSGMTIRDWFAGKAMNGYVAKEGPASDEDGDFVGMYAYQIADAMLAWRKR